MGRILLVKEHNLLSIADILFGVDGFVSINGKMIVYKSINGEL